MKKIVSFILAGIIAASVTTAVSAEEAYAEGVVFNKDHWYVANTYTGTIDGLTPGETVGDILEELENSRGIEVRRGDAALDSAEVLKSGDKVVLKAEDGTVKSEFTVCFMGDVNSDSKVNLADVSVMLKKIAKWDVTLSEIMADVNGDGGLNLADVSSVLKVVARWGNGKFNKTPVFPGKASDGAMDIVPCYKRTTGGSGINPVCLSDGIHYDLGIKFTVAAGKYATKMEVHCPSFAENTGSLTISVYKWNGDYNSSVSAMPIYTKDFVDFKDNSLLVLDLRDSAGKGLMEGEYVWRIHNGTDTEGNGVGVYFYPSQGPEGANGMQSFLNCKEFNIGPDARIYYAEIK